MADGYASFSIWGDQMQRMNDTLHFHFTFFWQNLDLDFSDWLFMADWASLHHPKPNHFEVTGRSETLLGLAAKRNQTNTMMARIHSVYQPQRNGWYSEDFICNKKRILRYDMSLAVEVAGFGLCQITSPYSLLVICVQQESFQAWTVYRRYDNFLSLLEQLRILHPSVPSVPAFNPNNLAVSNLDGLRYAMDRW